MGTYYVRVVKRRRVGGQTRRYGRFTRVEAPSRIAAARMFGSRTRQYQRNAIGLTATGMTLGVGASALGAMPAAPAGAGQSLERMAGFMPTMGTIAGGGTAIGMLSDLQPKRRRRR